MLSVSFYSYLHSAHASTYESNVIISKLSTFFTWYFNSIACSQLSGLSRRFCNVQANTVMYNGTTIALNTLFCSLAQLSCLQDFWSLCSNHLWHNSNSVFNLLFTWPFFIEQCSHVLHQLHLAIVFFPITCSYITCTTSTLTGITFVSLQLIHIFHYSITSPSVHM